MDIKRLIYLAISLAITIFLIVILSIGIGSTPPLGKLISPSHGFWKNAEPSDASFSLDLVTPSLEHEVSVSFDERLVPHVFAQNDHDAYFVQGYLHAKFRLWEMDFTAYAASGRLSEVLGETLGDNNVLQQHDRKFRRLGMVYAAEVFLKSMEEDPLTNVAVQAYTDGVNAYINSMHPEDYPIEYKLLNYAPEPWTNLKSALIGKYLSYQLTTDFDDFDYTYLRDQLGLQNYEKLYPLEGDSVSPIVPKGTNFFITGSIPTRPDINTDSSYANLTAATTNTNLRSADIGSNNWVVSGNRTASGRPILCNDPHLPLNLPSIWYEIQLHTPQYNVYGVSIPGTPSVIVGFNDSIAWGITNASRDVMDFYEIRFKDSTRNEYWYNGSWQKTVWRNETIHVKGKPDFEEKIPMTIWGPVMYDASYQNNLKDGKAYAVRWTAHDPGNILSVFMKLNRAQNYRNFMDAIRDFTNPAQNFVYASKRNTIAFWQMGELPARWNMQGDFTMPGWDKTYAWQQYIAFNDKLYEVNPVRGYLSSANQLPADTTYPYYLGGRYDTYRGISINRMLNALDTNVTVEDMKLMQTSVYDVFAEMALPVMINNVDESRLTPNGKDFYRNVKSWNYQATADGTSKTIFNSWWNNFKDTVWSDDIKKTKNYQPPYPDDEVLLEGILRDSVYRFVDNSATPKFETLTDMLTASLNKTAVQLTDYPPTWADYQKVAVSHLLKLPAFSKSNLYVGGGSKIINAVTGDHGPSWRMIVEMLDDTEAYGVYPGGQSGNPGSKYYTQFIDTWVEGEWYPLWIMRPADAVDARVKWTMHFKPSSKQNVSE